MNTENTTSNISSGNHLLNAEEIAALLNISLAFAYRLMQSGQIPTVKLGRVVRVRPEDLHSYIQLNLQRQVDAS